MLRAPRPLRWASVLTVLGLAYPLASASRGQVSPNGPEFQVNTYTTGLQQYPAVASDARGNFVVAWQSYGAGTDQDASIQLQRFGASGAPLGGEFQVNTYTTGPQSYPALAMDDQGDFILVWESDYSTGTDNSHSVQARLFAAAGTPLGPEFQVNTYTFGRQAHPAVAMTGPSIFVVVWSSYGSSGSDTTSYSIQGRRFGADGVPQGPQFQVNTYTTDYQVFPAVAAGAESSFVVVWQSAGSFGTDPRSFSIQGQRIAADGTFLGSQFQVNGYTTSFQLWPAIAADGGGNFVVVWTSYGSNGSDSSHYSIQAQLYAADGEPVGPEFEVNSYTSNTQQLARVAVAPQGNFVVTWESYGSPGNDAVAASIQAQIFDGSGAALGEQFQVNTYTTRSQRWADVALDATGNLVIAWASSGSFGTDMDATSVQGQRYDGLFRDGFESGDTSRWSMTLPELERGAPPLRVASRAVLGSQTVPGSRRLP
jgi:hypothetical protein